MSDKPNWTDRELLASGEEADFEIVYHRHHHQVTRLCHALCSNRSDADELVNDAFWRLRTLTESKELQHESAWPFLSTIIGFRSQDRRKVGGITMIPRSQSIVLHPLDTQLERLRRNQTAEAAGSTERALAIEAIEELRDRLSHMLSDSDVDFLAVVAAMTYDGHSQGEIADRLEIHHPTFRSRLSRLRSRLQRRSRAGNVEPDLTTKEEAG